MKAREQVRRPGEPALQRALWGGLILVVIGVVAAGSWSLIRERKTAVRASAYRSARLPVYGSVPDFSLIERSGRRVERSDLLGKIWIVNFMYTHCPDTCPLQSAEMARLQADFLSEPEVRLVSVTSDPQRDTPRVLSRYADRFGADRERWLFLTGEREAIYRLAQEGLRLPLLDPRNERPVPGRRGVRSEGLNPQQTRLFSRHVSDPRAGAAFLNGALPRAFETAATLAGEGVEGARVLHSSRFVLVDRRAQIRNYYDSTDVESLGQLRQDMKALLQEE